MTSDSELTEFERDFLQRLLRTLFKFKAMDFMGKHQIKIVRKIILKLKRKAK